MAEEMVLRIVLEGVDNASDDLTRTGDAADEMGDSFTNAEKKGAALVLSVNALASGLNQMSGGLRKSADSMERLGWISDDTAESMRGASDVMEAFAGPMELISGFVTTVAGLVYVLGQLGVTWAGVGTAVTTVAGTIAAGLASPALIVGLLITLLTTLAVIIYVEFGDAMREWSHQWIDLGSQIEKVNNGIKGATEAAQDFSHAVQNITLSGLRENLERERIGVGSKGLA